MKSARGNARRPSKAPPTTRKGTAADPVAGPKVPFDLRLGTFFLWLLLLVPPFIVARVAKESFRQPKLMVSEWIVLASLLCLAWGLRRVGEIRLADLWRLPAVRIALPVLLVGTAGLLTTRHPAHTREAVVDLWVGAAALVGWSAALPAPRLERLLQALLIPAVILGFIGMLQFHGLWQPLDLFGLAPGSRLSVTSYAGNPGDLGAYLVLPALIAQELLRRRVREGGWKSPAVWGTALALAVCVYSLLITQTLAAVAALVTGSLLLWASVLPRRLTVLGLAGTALAAALLVAVVPPLRERVVEKGKQAFQGDLNMVLTGRLDGWNAAVRMLEDRPLTGVGHGAYRPEFVPAKLALLDEGVAFFPNQTQVVFANAHNEYLEVAAEWGVPGLLVLGWGLWMLLGALRRRDRPVEERGLAWAGTAALAVLSVVHFPFRVALVAFPAILFLSWVLDGAREEAA
ncbi:MAG TPA: O-antigen ligase family protein [Thermoanaerobaculia bacterium]|nr:O-antigen ligase family protein [Thermoanaerobaculia bacterium]